MEIDKHFAIKLIEELSIMAVKRHTGSDILIKGRQQLIDRLHGGELTPRQVVDMYLTDLPLYKEKESDV